MALEVCFKQFQLLNLILLQDNEHKADVDQLELFWQISMAEKNVLVHVCVIERKIE